MNGLVEYPGKYRTKGVGIVKGSKIEHLAPPYTNVPFLMNDLFDYLKDKTELTLIKSCVFHYEMEFIHPFIDGNGRMGRFIMNLMLASGGYPWTVIPVQQRSKYMKSLEEASVNLNILPFVEFLSHLVNESMQGKPVASIS